MEKVEVRHCEAPEADTPQHARDRPPGERHLVRRAAVVDLERLALEHEQHLRIREIRLRKHEAPPATEDATGFLEGHLDVEVVEDRAAVDHVEGSVAERKGFGVAADEPGHGTDLRAGLGQEIPREIERDYPGARRGHTPRELPGAAPELQRARRARCDPSRRTGARGDRRERGRRASSSRGWSRYPARRRRRNARALGRDDPRPVQPSPCPQKPPSRRSFARVMHQSIFRPSRNAFTFDLPAVRAFSADGISANLNPARWALIRNSRMYSKPGDVAVIAWATSRRTAA